MINKVSVERREGWQRTATIVEVGKCDCIKLLALEFKVKISFTGYRGNHFLFIMMPCLMLDETPKSHNKAEYENGPSSPYRSEESAWLYYQLEQGADFLMIDCRPFSDYSKAHIEGAINLAISDLMLRRLKKGNMPLVNLMNSDTSKEKFERRAQFERIIIYDSNSRKDNLDNNVVKFLLTKLSDENRVCFLEGSIIMYKSSRYVEKNFYL